MTETTIQATPSASDVASLLGTKTAAEPAKTPVVTETPKPAGDVAAQRAADAMKRAPATEPAPLQKLKPRVSHLEPSESEFEDTNATRQRVAGAEKPTIAEFAPATVQPPTETEGVIQPIEESVAEPTHDQVLSEMREQMETLARQNLQQYGLSPEHVLTSSGQAAAAAPVPQPAPVQASVAPVTAQGYAPQFSLRLTAEEHAAALTTPDGMEKVLMKVAQQAYQQGRLATLQEDLPSVNKGVMDVVDRQVAARAFFIENRDLKPYAATVALVAAKLRGTGKYNDTDSLLADVAKEVRSTLRMGNGAAVEAASQAIASAKVNGKPVVTAKFAGTGAATTSRAGATNGTGVNKNKLQGDNISEDMAILASGLQ